MAISEHLADGNRAPGEGHAPAVDVIDIPDCVDGIHSLLDQAFFGTHWRRSPALFPGAAAALLPSPPSSEEMMHLADARGEVQTDGRSVWFVEQVIDELPAIGALCGAARSHLEWGACWCDLIVTKGPSSIGCHYDANDNFSIQLTGSKRWRLSPPTDLPLESRRSRLTRQSSDGQAALGVDTHEVIVEPGDILYIPQLWIHWGESQGSSTSVSLVVGNHCAYHVLESALNETLVEHPSWWSSMPVGPGTSAARAQQIDEAVATLASPAVQRAIVTRSRRNSSLGGAGRKASTSSKVDLPTVQRYLERTAVDLPATVSAEWLLRDSGSDQLLRARAGRNLRKLLRLVAINEKHTGYDARRLTTSALATLIDQSHPVIDRICTEPEIEVLLDGPVGGPSTRGGPTGDALAHHLAGVLLPEIAAANEVTVVRHPADPAEGFTLRRAGVHVKPSEPSDYLLWVTEAGALHFVGPEGLTRVDAGETPGLGHLPMTAGGHCLAAPLSAWLQPAVWHGPSGQQAGSDGTVVQDALRLLEQHAPEQLALVVTWVRCVVWSPDGRAMQLRPDTGVAASRPGDAIDVAGGLISSAATTAFRRFIDVEASASGPEASAHDAAVTTGSEASRALERCIAAGEEATLLARLPGTAPAQAARAERLVTDSMQALRSLRATATLSPGQMRLAAEAATRLEGVG